MEEGRCENNEMVVQTKEHEKRPRTTAMERALCRWLECISKHNKLVPHRITVTEHSVLVGRYSSAPLNTAHRERRVCTVKWRQRPFSRPRCNSKHACQDTASWCKVQSHLPSTTPLLELSSELLCGHRKTRGLSLTLSWPKRVPLRIDRVEAPRAQTTSHKHTNIDMGHMKNVCAIVCPARRPPTHTPLCKD